ncbi:MAG: cobyrinate a,c-diamide synthase [Desulfatiglans sp.]|nr:cobyrinate a,c-diamide synthase [Thermodesulfobacteriota bacterium]MEE4354127.1 cobyrinate a,c-diamide synthase [Desulfatiglans sp.]
MDWSGKKSIKRPRIVITALRGGSGKTIISLGLISALRERGYQVAPFKKGPDFIDPGWLSFSADRPCHNLDPFLMSKETILHSFLTHSEGWDISVLEGNRGLFDSPDLEGHYSTAELAKLLMAPVILVLDITMATRSMAAVVMGCQSFDPDLNIAGIILNRVAGPRQERLVRESIGKYCRIPVVGSIPRLKENVFPERHMGLIPLKEREHAEKAVLWARSIVKKNLLLDRIWEIANEAEPMKSDQPYTGGRPETKVPTDSPTIGFIRDRAFWFYYPENLEQLEKAGAKLVEIDSIQHKELPPIDALYIGGGFPETQAQALTDNYVFREALREEINAGLPVYAECGGFMYLGESLIVRDKTYPMVGALPVRFVLQKRPEGHGYTVLKVRSPNLFYEVNKEIKGHEFHYSRPQVTKNNVDFAFEVMRGKGIEKKRDGIVKGNVLATYSHIHGAENKVWAESMVRAGLNYKKTKKLQKTQKKN